MCAVQGTCDSARRAYVGDVAARSRPCRRLGTSAQRRLALSRAKASGKGPHRYRRGDDGARLQAVGQLRRALSSEQRVLQYQP